MREVWPRCLPMLCLTQGIGLGMAFQVAKLAACLKPCLVHSGRPNAQCSEKNWGKVREFEFTIRLPSAMSATSLLSVDEKAKQLPQSAASVVLRLTC